MPNADRILELARAANAEGHDATAFELYRRAIALDGGKDGAIYAAVLNLLEIGRISDAKRYFDQIRRNAAPKPWLIEITLGRLCLAQFRPIEAEKHFKKATELGKNSTMPAVFLADCLQKLEKFDEATDVLVEALNAEGDLDEVYLNLALVKRAQGDYCAARNFLLKALEIEPEYSDAKRVLTDVESCLNLPDMNQ